MLDPHVRTIFLGPIPPATAALIPLAAFKPIWVVGKTMVPFWVLSIVRHLVFRGILKPYDVKFPSERDNLPHTVKTMVPFRESILKGI